jgi:hypothetical protein
MSNTSANYGHGQSKTPSNASSDGSPIKEETFIESIKSQVDSGNIEDIIRGQKRALVKNKIGQFHILPFKIGTFRKNQ